MDKAQPSRPVRAKKTSFEPEPEVIQVTDESDNKYAPRQKVGRAVIGVPNRVETVGLGNLKVTTAHGYTDVRSN